MKLPEIVFLLRIQLAVCDALPFHMNFYLHCHGSMKNVNRIFTRLHCRLHLGMLMRIGKTGNLFTGSGSTNCIAIIEINMKVKKKKLQREIPHDA